MKYNSFETFSRAFQILCILGTLSLLTWCIWQFSKDEDFAEISFKKYGVDKNSVYPDISLCFEPFLKNGQLRKRKTSAPEYYKYLNGLKHDERLRSIDFEKVSLQLEDKLVMKSIFLSKNHTIDLDQSTSFGLPFLKCFTFSLPTKKKIKTVLIGLRNSVFMASKRSKAKFILSFHHPNQKFRGWQFTWDDWPRKFKRSTKASIINVHVKEIEILKRRFKKNDACVTGNFYDSEVIDEMIDTIGCIPPYWNMSTIANVPDCTSSGQLLSFRNLLVDAMSGSGQYEDASPPCDEFQTINADVKEKDLKINKTTSTFEFDEMGDLTGKLKDAWIDQGK